MESKQKKMLKINAKQREFYDNPEMQRGIITKAWNSIRNTTLNSFRTRINIKKDDL